MCARYAIKWLNRNAKLIFQHEHNQMRCTKNSALCVLIQCFNFDFIGLTV